MPVGESMEEWRHALLDDRRCMDCKTAIVGLDGAMVFRGQLPQTGLVGHLCQECWEWRETLRQVRHEQSEEQ
jgi:hypothetical protein